MSDEQIRIDFYVLDDSAPDARARFACRLGEKAWKLGHRVHALAPSESAARALDELLWTFRQGSFVPHELWQGQAPEAPVTVGHDPARAPAAELLINLTDEIPACFDGFARVAEIVDGDAACREAGRARLRLYRDQGLDPQTHRIG